MARFWASHCSLMYLIFSSFSALALAMASVAFFFGQRAAGFPGVLHFGDVPVLAQFFSFFHD